jgi:hypothetical protein
MLAIQEDVSRCTFMPFPRGHRPITFKDFAERLEDELLMEALININFVQHY